MQLALSTGSLWTYGLERVFALATEAGFEGIEVLVDARFDTRQPAYLRRLIERHGLPILAMHAPFRPDRLAAWPPTHPLSIAATAEVAAEVGAGVLVAHLPLLRDRAYERWLLRERPDWQAAHPHVTLAVENLPVKWFRWWPLTPLDIWRLNRPQGWAVFPHLTLDTTHLATKGMDPLAVYRILSRQVAHVHLSNARRQGRRIQEHRRLEDGFLDLAAFLGQLAQDHFPGIVTVELSPLSLEAEDEDKVRAHLRRQARLCKEWAGQR